MDIIKIATSDPSEWQQQIVFGNEGDERLVFDTLGDYCQIGKLYPGATAASVDWVITKEAAEELGLFLLRWVGLL